MQLFVDVNYRARLWDANIAAPVLRNLVASASIVTASQPEAGAPNGTSQTAQQPGSPLPADRHVAHVERGRIASLGGVVSVIWLVILVLMVWNS